MKLNSFSWTFIRLLPLIAATTLPVTVLAATELARVNSTVITLEDFNKKYQELLPLYQGKAPTKTNILDDLIKRELGIQEAKRLRLDRDPEVLEQMNTVLYQALLGKVLAKEFEKISITDTDVRAYYTRNPEVRTSHIFVAVPPGTSKADEAKAYARIKEINDKELKSGKTFAEVAQKMSDGVAAPMGGDIDYQMKDKLDPAYYAAALALKSPGNVSGIVRSQFGYHIIKLTGVRPWDEVDRSAVKQLVYNEKRQELFDRYMTQLRAKASVSSKANLLN